MSLITWLAMVLLMVFVGPVFSIWALNLLFDLSIPLNLYTWLSMAWLHLVLAKSGKK
jgi:hypothetical protein